jgi:hypothetical protein
MMSTILGIDPGKFKSVCNDYNGTTGRRDSPAVPQRGYIA